MCTVFPTNKQNHIRNPPKRNRRGGACVPARIAWQGRFHTKNTRIVCGGWTMDAPLWGDTGGQRRFHTHLHHIFPRIPHKQNNHLHAIRPKETNRPCAIRPYPSPPNRTVCPYPIGVILSIAQGWQVQRSLPWVTMQARRLPPWGLYSFSSHIITTRGE